MVVQYASDLHLEFSENKDFILQNPLKPYADILILAGDVMPFVQIDKHSDFLDYLADNFEHTYWLPGNHEYYGGDIAHRNGSFIEEIHPNVHLVNNYSVTIRDCQFIFSTLWSYVSLANQWNVQQSLNDYYTIRDDNGPFTVVRSNKLHSEGIAFIETQLTETTATKSIVTTHHVPTMMHYPDQYKGDSLNEAFATELYDNILELQPDYWLYGHHHANTLDFNIGKTQLLTNQLGYVKYGEHQSFDHKRTLSI